MKYTVVVHIEVETNDQPPADVRRRLANVRHRVGQEIGAAARRAAEGAIWVVWPEDYFPDWPENGKPAKVVRVTQRTLPGVPS